MKLLTLGFALGLATALSAQDAPRSVDRVALVGGTLIDGTGSAPLGDAIVLVEGARIQAAGRRGDVPIPPGTRLIDVTGKTVLPGFIDLHTHLTLPLHGVDAQNTDATRTVRALHYINLYLRSGITSVRDVAGVPSVFEALMRGQRDGSIASIRLFPTGRFITTEASATPHPGLFRLATGPWDFRLAVRETYRSGFRHIKLGPPFSLEEISAAIAEAKLLGMRVTTHSSGFGGSMARIAADAGTNSFEHVNDLPDDFLDLMAAKGIQLVPTLAVLREYYRSVPLPSGAAGGPDRRLASFEEPFKKARHRGIVMGIGTDGIGRFSRLVADSFPHIGQAPDWYFVEMKYFVELGASPMEAIVAATRNGALILGEDARLGTLVPGKLADLQVIPGNPAESLDALGLPELVMVGGRIHSFPTSARPAGK
jgi:imidazolonepropionase-like amidohydrolase